MQKLKIVYVALADLVPYARNARVHSVDKIVASIKRFGFNDPVGIDARSGIIEGHGRVLAAEVLKMKEVPCVVLDHLSESEKRAYIIAHNKIPENSGWDFEMLAQEISDLVEMEVDVTDIGLDEMTLDAMLKVDPGLLPENQPPQPKAQPAKKAAPEAPAEKKTVTTCPHCLKEFTSATYGK
jgi:hypothetical protein